MWKSKQRHAEHETVEEGEEGEEGEKPKVVRKCKEAQEEDEYNNDAKSRKRLLRKHLSPSFLPRIFDIYPLISSACRQS